MAHITIDYTPAVHQAAGIGRLTREVVRALLELDAPRLGAPSRSAPHRFTLFCMGGTGNARMANDGRRSSFVICPFTDRWLYRLWHRARVPVPVEVFAGRSDLYHATDFVLPPVSAGKRTVLTVHDLTFERAPDATPPRLLSFLKRVVPQSVRRATHIVADSQATARDLTELYGVAPEKITVIYSGVDVRFAGVDSRQSTLDSRQSTLDFRLSTFDSPNADEAVLVRRKYGLGDAPYILTVGTLQPRKNHVTLVRAFARIRAQNTEHRTQNTEHRTQNTEHRAKNAEHRTQSGALDAQLVIAGGRGWLYDDVAAEADRLGIAGRVKFIGFADEADLPALYRAASVFAFPSLYEGFGIPPLEAMACGVPVVASNAASLPEVMGGAGLAVDPLDVDGLASALDRALHDAPWRQAAIAAGLARARLFTWPRAAEQLLAVYDRVLSTRV